MPYYFGSRLIFYRKDVWEAANLDIPETLDEFNDAVKSLRTDDMSGFYLGGEDWRNAISWIFANGGEIAVEDGGEWSGALSSPETQDGLKAFQGLFTDASNAPVTESDSTPWVNINDNDDGEPEAATIIAPGWAYWSIGIADEADEEAVEWDDDTFGVFALPGASADEVAPVFAGGSNIAISAASEKQDLAADLMRIIFSDEYQTMLAENGLGPANTTLMDAFVDLNPVVNEPAADAALGSKLTPAAPGWAAFEGANIRSEEHTSELQSRGHLVCRLLLEKKKQQAGRKGMEDVLIRPPFVVGPVGRANSQSTMLMDRRCMRSPYEAVNICARPQGHDYMSG